MRVHTTPSEFFSGLRSERKLVNIIYSGAHIVTSMGLFDLFRSGNSSTSAWTQHMDRADLGKGVTIDFADLAKTMRAVSTGIQSPDPKVKAKAMARGAEAAFMLKLAMDGLPKRSKQQLPKEVQTLLNAFSKLSSKDMILKGALAISAEEVKAYTAYMKAYFLKNAPKGMVADFNKVLSAKNRTAAFKWFITRYKSVIGAGNLPMARAVYYWLSALGAQTPTPSGIMPMMLFPIFMVGGTVGDDTPLLVLGLAIGLFLGVLILMIPVTAVAAPAVAPAAPVVAASPDASPAILAITLMITTIVVERAYWFIDKS